MRRLLAALGIAGILVGMIASPALAGEPTRERFVDELEFDLDCGSFMIHESAIDRITVLEWFDKDGEWLRAAVHHSWSGTITGPGGVLELSDPGHWTDFFSRTGLRQIGLIYNIHIRGLGAVIKDAGAIIFDDSGGVTIHGPHEAFVDGAEAVFCPLFE